MQKQMQTRRSTAKGEKNYESVKCGGMPPEQLNGWEVL